MKKRFLVIVLFFFPILFVSFRLINQNTVLESTTQNIQVVSKEQDIATAELWIVLSNDRKVYIEDLSIWALINVNQNYTIVYDLMKKSQRYELRTIVPGDYNGQF